MDRDHMIRLLIPRVMRKYPGMGREEVKLRLLKLSPAARKLLWKRTMAQFLGGMERLNGTQTN